jgi:hypothetical protein
MDTTHPQLDSDPPQGSNDSLNESTSTIVLLESPTPSQESSLNSSLNKKNKLSLQKQKKQANTSGPSSPLPLRVVLTGSESFSQAGAQNSRLDGDLAGPSFEPIRMLKTVQTPFNNVTLPPGATNRWPSVRDGVCTGSLRLTYGKNKAGPTSPEHFRQQLTTQAINPQLPKKSINILKISVLQMGTLYQVPYLH